MCRPWLALSGSLILAACTVEIPGTDLGGGDDSNGGGGSNGGGTGSSSDPAGGKLTLNGLELDLLALMDLDPAALGHWESDTVAIADSGSIDPLLAHASGAEHLEYLALCALDEGTELVAGGASYPGLFGLGAEWVDAGCGESCQRWISGCVLAHANAYGIAVEMSLRGGHAGMTWDDQIASEFTLQEAAFYGNVFQVTGLDYPRQPLYACYGRALLAWDDDDEDHESSIEYLRKRICGTGDCGLNNTGPCTAPVQAGSICAADAGWEGYYADCEGENFVDPEQIPVYPEVVTTYQVEE